MSIIGCFYFVSFCVDSKIEPSTKTKIYPLPHMYVVKDLVPVSIFKRPFTCYVT